MAKLGGRRVRCWAWRRQAVLVLDEPRLALDVPRVQEGVVPRLLGPEHEEDVLGVAETLDLGGHLQIGIALHFIGCAMDLHCISISVHWVCTGFALNCVGFPWDLHRRLIIGFALDVIGFALEFIGFALYVIGFALQSVASDLHWIPWDLHD